jgi:hypothetical protein
MLGLAKMQTVIIYIRFPNSENTKQQCLVHRSYVDAMDTRIRMFLTINITGQKIQRVHSHVQILICLYKYQFRRNLLNILQML